MTINTNTIQLNHIEKVEPWITEMKNGVLYSSAFSDRTIKEYVRIITKVLQHGDMSIDLYESYLSSIPHSQYASREKAYKAIVCFAKYLIKKKALTIEVLNEIKSYRPRGNPKPKRDVLTQAELNDLLSYQLELLDRLIIELLVNTGMRASEACNIKIKNVNMSKNEILLERRKGGKPQLIGAPSHVFKLIQDYLSTRQALDPNMPLLVNSRGRAFNKDSLSRRLRRLENKTGIKPNPHALRRTFATVNAKTRPITDIQIALGHANINTTRQYIITHEQDVADAMKEWSITTPA